jgi:putative flippase GtrA
MKKTVKKWTFKTIQTRQVEEYLNRVSLEGEKVVGVYGTSTLAGSLDVLTYHDEEVQVAPKPTGRTDAAKA